MQRPYLLRAMHEWMTDNTLTPHIVIDVAAANTALPVEYAKDGKLIINISYSATENLFIDNEHTSFDARFDGVSRHLDVPISAIVGIYARESGQGMIFSSEQPASPEASAADATDSPQIQVVPESSAADEEAAAQQPDGEPGAAASADEHTDRGDRPGTDRSGAPKRSRPQLKIIK